MEQRGAEKIFNYCNGLLLKRNKRKRGTLPGTRPKKGGKRGSRKRKNAGRTTAKPSCCKKKNGTCQVKGKKPGGGRVIENVTGLENELPYQEDHNQKRWISLKLRASKERAVDNECQAKARKK